MKVIKYPFPSAVFVVAAVLLIWFVFSQYAGNVFWLGLSILGVYLLLAGLNLIIRICSKPKTIQHNRISKIQPDTPFTDWGKDLFGRKDYTERLAQGLTLPPDAPSIVIGLENQWGEGKTSVILEIEKKLWQDRVMVMRFSPWMTGGLENLIESFFHELSVCLEKFTPDCLAERPGASIHDYANAIINIADVFKQKPLGVLAASVLESFEEDTGIMERKARVNTAIRSTGRAFAIIIDDIDRLPPKDIQTVFQLVKCMCDFDRTAFLLAYEHGPVVEALSYDNTYDGRRFLEKMVQHTESIPPLMYHQKETFLEQKISEIEASLGITMDRGEGYYMPKLLALNLLSTPRQIVRLTNILTSYLKELNQEVSSQDILVFCTLKCVFPSISELIRAKADDYVSDPSYEGAIHEQLFVGRKDETDESRTKRKELVQTELENLNVNEHDQQLVIKALNYLFPYKFESIATGRKNLDDFSRIHKREALVKVLQCGTSEMALSIREAKEFIEHSSNRKKIILSHYQAGRLSDWLAFLESEIRKRQDTDIDVDAFVPVFNDTLKDIHRVYGGDHVHTFASTLYTILEILPEKSSSVLKILCENTEMLELAEEILLKFMADRGSFSFGEYNKNASPLHPGKKPDIQELDELREVWLKTLEEKAATENLFETAITPTSMMHRWGQFSDYEKPQQYIAGLCTDDQKIKTVLSHIGSETPESIKRLFADHTASAAHFAECGFQAFADKLTKMAERD